MTTKKYAKTLPGDFDGQKTTAVPTEQILQAEWTTPVHITGISSPLPMDVEFPTLQFVRAQDMEVRIDAVNAKLELIYTQLDQLIKSRPARTHVGYANTTKPTVGVNAGDAFLELDTKDVYLFDGTTWAVL